MSKPIKRFTVSAPAELFAEIEAQREALGNRCGIEPTLSRFAALAIERGLNDMKASEDKPA